VGGGGWPRSRGCAAVDGLPVHSGGLPEINCPIAGLIVLACNLHWQDSGAKGYELAERSEHPATDQNIPFRGRLPVSRTFSLPGTSKHSPAKAVSPKAFRSKVFEVKNKPPTETPPVGFEPTTGCLEDSSCKSQEPLL
jgi:hypothetical protein